ncbi:MAG: class I SAM-dependent methyltransferase [Candidatus Diapherotrites archaeon]|nr:class I SAM-dependent methyltransferase [Candidatus Diapherotrites archaeon]
MPKPRIPSRVKTVRKAIARAIHERPELVHPTLREPQPAYGLRHRLDKGHQKAKKAFIDFKKLRTQILRLKPIQTLLKNDLNVRKRLNRILREAVSETGFRATEELWGVRTAAAIKGGTRSISVRAKGMPTQMNEHAGKKVAQELRSVRNPNIVDIGTGGGETILELAKALSPEQRRNARITLVDVMTSDLTRTKLELSRLGIPFGNVRILPVSFVQLAESIGAKARSPFTGKTTRDSGTEREFKTMMGSADAVVSGATFNNFNNLQPIAKAVKSLLKPGGTMAVWDWAGVDTYAKKVSVVNARGEKKVRTTHGTQPTYRDSLKSFLDFWLKSWEFPEQVRTQLEHEINTAKRFDFEEFLHRHVNLLPENQRGNTKVARMNRAYRLPEDIAQDFQRTGFRITRTEYPFASTGVNVGNLTYLMLAKKK